ncbi:response regulator transcription factor [Mycobacterium sp. UM_Kg1]|uniref:response regulator transcription factor n=1 Tax=Mycobacterium sp. UM_Kg1 TaxID=1545691 RepID=UPI00061AB389|nr:response regulator transcription factor [Mycobacterium sp. UM_Kg1]
MTDFRPAERRGGGSGGSSTPRVLVVEDSETIREMVGEALSDAGYVTATMPDGHGLENVLDDFRPDLVVLDVMLPGRDGFALMDVIVKRGEAAVLLLTARGGLSDRLRGLEYGADDYVAKPFELAELVARVGAVLRRRGRLPSALNIGDLTIDVEAGAASRSGAPLNLTATELRVLVFLVEQRGRIVSAGQILTAVWGQEAEDPDLVEAHLDALRGKLEALGPQILHAVRGMGYRLEIPGS